MWEITKVKESTDRHIHCDEPVIEFTRWEVAVVQTVPAVELCDFVEEPEVKERRAA